MSGRQQPQSRSVRLARVAVADPNAGLPPNSDGSPIIRFPYRSASAAAQSNPGGFPAKATDYTIDTEYQMQGAHSQFVIESRSGLLVQDDWFNGGWYPRQGN